MNYEVDGILSGDISIRVEESKRMVGARIDCYLDILLQSIVLAGNCLGSSERALVVGVADIELVV